MSRSRDLGGNHASSGRPGHLQWLSRLRLLEVHLDDAERRLLIPTCRLPCFYSGPPHGRRVSDELAPTHSNIIEFLKLGVVVKYPFVHNPP